MGGKSGVFAVNTPGLRDFPGSPVVKTPLSHCRGPGLIIPGGELGSHMLGGAAKKTPNKQTLN